MARRIKIDNAVLKRAKKKVSYRKFCNILIVCEGEKTEPNYFKAFKGYRIGSIVIDLHIQGMGDNTMNIVNKAIEQKKESSNKFDAVWAVFDRDSFPENNFNSAILKAKEHKISVAWSNEAFELWYLYHFQNRTTRMSRNTYKDAITTAVKQKMSVKRNYCYRKNNPNNYAIMNKYGNQAQAILWAEAQHKKWTDQKFAKHNPCTTVYQLVRQLIGEDAEFNERVLQDINMP